MDQNIENLKNYIRQQIENRISPTEIQQQLLGAGHTQQNVDAAFDIVQQEILPAPPQHSSDSIDTVSPADVPQANGKKRGRIKTAWILLRQSVTVLRGNPYLLRYLGMTYAWILLTTGLFIGIYFLYFTVFTDSSDQLGNDTSYLGYVFAFLTYIITYFIINFYAAALAANMLDIFRGKKSDYGTYVGVAKSKAGTIFVFSLISASVGMFLQYVVERIRFVGWIISWLLGTAWNLGTMFVLPIIVEEEASAPTAIKRSISFFKQTWGENIAAKISVNLPIALLQFGLIIPFGFAFYGAALTGSISLIIAVIIVFFIISLTLAIVGSFANSLINTALYYYAAHKQIPAAFSADMLNSVFIQKKKRKFFGRSNA